MFDITPLKTCGIDDIYVYPRLYIPDYCKLEKLDEGLAKPHEGCFTVLPRLHPLHVRSSTFTLKFPFVRVIPLSNSLLRSVKNLYFSLVSNTSSSSIRGSNMEASK